MAALMVMVTVGAVAVPLPPVACTDADTLEALVSCVVASMPRRDHGPLPSPQPDTLEAWRFFVQRALSGVCDAALLPSEMRGAYEVRWFFDARDPLPYCVVVEVADGDGDGVVDRAWGTLIVRSWPGTRELGIHIAHPLADWGTELQGIGVFRETQARMFLMAGAHRHADPAPSACQEPHSASDVAHACANLFHHAVAAQADHMDRLGVDWAALQFHGMAATTCPGVDVYITEGLATAPDAGGAASRLRGHLVDAHDAWRVRLPGEDPGCGLNGTTNVQGRLLNGVAREEVCDVPAAWSTGRFLHIEQAPGHRDAEDWVAAVRATWPLAGEGGVPVGAG